MAATDTIIAGSAILAGHRHINGRGPVAAPANASVRPLTVVTRSAFVGTLDGDDAPGIPTISFLELTTGNGTATTSDRAIAGPRSPVHAGANGGGCVGDSK